MPTVTGDEPFIKRLWEYVCPFQKYLLVVGIVEIILLLLLVFSLVVGVEPGSPSYYILQIDFVIVSATLLFIGYAYRRCKRRERV